MQDIVRSKLSELVGRFGLDLPADPKRCEGLLRDVCGEHKKEILALVSAAREGVGGELQQSSAGVPKELIVARLSKRLHDNTGLAEDLARWAVESWAIALGFATAKEFRFPFKCPRCGAQGNIATKLAGQKTRCPKCGTNLFIADNGREVFLAPDPNGPTQTVAAAPGGSSSSGVHSGRSTASGTGQATAKTAAPVKPKPAAPLPVAQPLAASSVGAVPAAPCPPEADDPLGFLQETTQTRSQPVVTTSREREALGFLDQISQPASIPTPQAAPASPMMPAAYPPPELPVGYADQDYGLQRPVGKSHQSTATASLIASILGMLFSCIPIVSLPLGIAGIVLATKAMGEMTQSHNETGKGIALAGLIVGIAACAFAALVFLIYFAANLET